MGVGVGTATTLAMGIHELAADANHWRCSTAGPIANSASAALNPATFAFSTARQSLVRAAQSQGLALWHQLWTQALHGLEVPVDDGNHALFKIAPVGDADSIPTRGALSS